MSHDPKDPPCPICGQSDWRPSNLSGCRCEPYTRLMAERDAARTTERERIARLAEAEAKRWRGGRGCLVSAREVAESFNAFAAKFRADGGPATVDICDDCGVQYTVSEGRGCGCPMRTFKEDNKRLRAEVERLRAANRILARSADSAARDEARRLLLDAPPAKPSAPHDSGHIPSIMTPLDEALAAWRGLPDVARGTVQLACLARGEDEPAFDAAVALLRATAEVKHG